MKDEGKRLRDVGRSLMVVHGAGMSILLSQLGAALEKPALFAFIQAPLGLVVVGFVLAMVSIVLIEMSFDIEAWRFPLYGVTWTVLGGSFACVLVALVVGGWQLSILSNGIS